jgi:HK97 family phage portal protein
MFHSLRTSMASGFALLARRLSRDPRHPETARIWQGARTMAGVAVTADTAITVAAVWACLRYLSQTVAVLPWHVMKDGDTGAAIQDRHPIDWLLYKRPNPEWSSFQFRETLTHWALRYGNGYAEIEPDQMGRPFAMWPIHPERVQVCRATEPGTAAYGDALSPGGLYYEVTNGDGYKANFAARRIYHIRGFGEGVVGLDVIRYAAQSIGWARAAQLFGGAFFGNGANVSLAVINKNPLSPDGLLLQRAEFDKIGKGRNNWHNAIHLGGDGDVKRIGLNAEETQLIEVHQFLVEEICRWFGVPPHKVMHLLRATFSNIEHQAIEVVVDSVSPWVKRFEDEADYKLFGQNRPGLYTKMNMRALMRGDNASRVQFYKEMVGIGAYSPNRVLELEDENTIGPDGDIHVMQSQWTTLDKIGQEPEPARGIGDNGGPALDDDDDPPEDEVAAMTALIELDERVIA